MTEGELLAVLSLVLVSGDDRWDGWDTLGSHTVGESTVLPHLSVLATELSITMSVRTN